MQDYAQAAAIDSDAPEIHQAEQRLISAIGELDICLDALATRLERVLRAPEPQTAPTDMLEMVTPLRSPLADYLHAQAARVEAEYNRVSDLLRRLAL